MRDTKSNIYKFKKKSIFFIALSLFLLARPIIAQDTASLLFTEDSRAIAHIDLIENAKETLELSYYHIDNDIIGKAFFAALRNAARRGVKVRFIIDGLNNIPDDLVTYLAKEGVEIKKYHHAEKVVTEPTKTPVSWLWQRSHDKFVIADGKTLLSNTENMTEGYYGSLVQNGQHRYVGRALLINGEAAKEAQVYHQVRWNSPDVTSLKNRQLSKKNMQKSKRILITTKNFITISAKDLKKEKRPVT